MRFFNRWSCKLSGCAWLCSASIATIEVAMLLAQTGKLVSNRRVADLDHPAAVVHLANLARLAR